MNKSGRKRNSRCWAINKISEMSKKNNQPEISNFLSKQHKNNQLIYSAKLPDVSLSSSDDPAITRHPLSSPACKVIKVPSDCKENCMKSGQNYLEHTTDTLSVNGSINEKEKNVKERKSRKQMLSQNHQLTHYFPVRRSCRKTLSNAKKERQNIVEDAILSGKEEGFEIKEFPGKGRGVITKKPIKRGEFVLEYYGELIEYEEAKKREAVYATKENTGCYMYYFKYKNKRFCIDATKETNRLGRLVNHSKKGNLKTQPFLIKESPHLVLLAGRDIEPGEELSYDYGDRRKIALESHPWLAL